MVLATQNPHEHYGTYPLPESQRDRFSLRIDIGYAAADVEAKLLERAPQRRIASREPDAGANHGTAAELLAAQAAADDITVHPDIARYAQSVVGQTRNSTGLRLGVSTRGALAWIGAARARAFLSGRAFVSIDDVQDLAVPALAHRVLTRDETSSDGTALAGELIRAILASTPVPL